MLVGEAPGRDESLKDLHLSLALKAIGFRGRRRTDAIQDLAHMTMLEGADPRLRQFVDSTVHVNLLYEYPGAGRRGAHFPQARGKERAKKFLEMVSVPGREYRVFNGVVFGSPQVVLLAGLRVARAFGLRMNHKDRPSFSYFEKKIFKDQPNQTIFEVVVVPHPSGVNRWWNDPQNEARAREFLAALGERAGARTGDPGVVPVKAASPLTETSP